MEGTTNKNVIATHRLKEKKTNLCPACHLMVTMTDEEDPPDPRLGDLIRGLQEMNNERERLVNILMQQCYVHCTAQNSCHNIPRRVN